MELRYSRQMQRTLFVLLAAMAVALAACGGDGSTKESSIEAIGERSAPLLEAGDSARAKGPPAPELVGIAGWINTEPFRLADLRGKVVLVDIWTYSCVNCIRTLPYLKEWHNKYADQDLVIVGVHAPEFEFEKSLENVEMAVLRYGIEYPVVQDNDMETWRAYNNRVWPAKYLIGADGSIRYKHFGEGAYDETEQEIRKALEEIGASVSDIPARTDPPPRPDSRAFANSKTGQTRELYAGYLRNLTTDAPYFGDLAYYSTPTDTSFAYRDPGEHRNHFLYLQGLWINGPESIIHARATENLEDYVALKFFGTSANAVFGFDGGEPIRVVVTLDGAPLSDTHRGADIQVDEGGSTFFLVDEARLYGIVEQPEYAGHELRLASNSDRLSLFAFTFGSYAQGA